MKKLDAKLRTTPEKDRVWRVAFLKARHGWHWLNTAKENLKHEHDAFAETCLQKAEERLTEALQLLAIVGMDSGELAHHIRKSLAEMETKRVAV